MSSLAPTAGVQLSPVWINTLLSFNLRPVLYMHPSRLPIWASDPLSLSPSVVNALSQEILDQFSLVDDCDWSMPEPAARLFMINASDREKIAMALGVSAYRRDLRKIVLKVHVSVLRTVLGNTIDCLWLPVSEAVENSNRTLKIQWNALDNIALHQQVVEEGYQQMLKLLDRSRSAVWKRAILCTPSKYTFVPCAPTQALDGQRLLDRIVTDILPRWAPRWTWLF